MNRTMKSLVAIVVTLALLACCLLSFTACDEKVRVLEEDTRYNIQINTEIMTLPISVLTTFQIVQPDDIFFELKADGTMKMHIGFGDDLVDTAIDLVEGVTGEPFDLSSLLGDIDIIGALSLYAEAIVPGFDINDPEGSFELLRKSTGLSIEGIDWGSDKVKEVITCLQNGSQLTELTVPNGIALEYNGPYHIETLTDSNGNTFDAVYMGKDEDPYMMFKMGTSDTGKKTLSFRVELFQLYGTAIAE